LAARDGEQEAGHADDVWVITRGEEHIAPGRPALRVIHQCYEVFLLQVCAKPLAAIETLYAQTGGLEFAHKLLWQKNVDRRFACPDRRDPRLEQVWKGLIVTTRPLNRPTVRGEAVQRRDKQQRIGVRYTLQLG
jgi:hypothetical protein